MTATTTAHRTVHCPTCHSTLGGDWSAVHCYCTEWVPTDRASVGSLIEDREVVRLTEHGTLVAVSR